MHAGIFKPSQIVFRSELKSFCRLNYSSKDPKSTLWFLNHSNVVLPFEKTRENSMMNCTEIIQVHSLQKYTMATFSSGEWVVFFFFYNVTITFVDSIIKECCLHPGELRFVCLVFLFLFFFSCQRSKVSTRMPL